MFGMNGMTPQEREELNGKQDLPVIVDIIDTTPEINVADNTDYRCGTITSLDITIPQDAKSGNIPLYAAIIRFTTDNTIPQVSYDDIYLKGDNIDIESDSEGSYYVFDVQPNTRYCIGVEWDGERIIGYVSGAELIDNGTELSGNDN